MLPSMEGTKLGYMYRLRMNPRRGFQRCKGSQAIAFRAGLTGLILPQESLVSVSSRPYSRLISSMGNEGSLPLATESWLVAHVSVRASDEWCNPSYW